MFAIIGEAWRELSATGKAAVLVVLVLAGAGLLALAMWLRYDLGWFPAWLTSVTTSSQ